MIEAAAREKLNKVQTDWQNRKLFSASLIILSGAIILVSFLHLFTAISYWWILCIWALFFSVFYLNRTLWHFSEKEVANYLNKKYPILEESLDLILVPEEKKTALERLQVQKIGGLFLEQSILPPFIGLLNRSIFALAGAILFCTIFFFYSNQLSLTKNIGRASSTKNKESILPEIKSVFIQITPPVYTGKKVRAQSNYSVLAEESSSIEWKLETNQTIDSIVLIMNDSLHLRFTANNKNRTQWQLNLLAKQNGIYQIKLLTKISEHYAFELIRDQVPLIQIQSPKQYAVLDYGEPQQLSLVASIKDDYGILTANLVATVASGGGEAVKFKEHQFPLLTNSASSFLQSQLNKKIDLKTLNMQPGDELYYYIKAIDNHQQEARSDIYILKLTDTAELKEMNGIVNAINVKPDYFRSQRQIIIETEQLLRDQDTISTQQFKQRSNELGVDQKLLRLRYGKFLGEESEGNIGDSRFDTDDDHGSGNNVTFGDANSVIDAYSHKHDNAEDASFFDTETKKQLKAVLTEMWGAELKLRTFFPKEALPFEYKALRLLKELQQSSRAYVAKTNVKTTPLKFEKRLTGELTKILPLALQFQLQKSTDLDAAVRKTLGILLTIKSREFPLADDLIQMQTTLVILNRLAIEKPAEYLLSYESFKRLFTNYQNQTAWDRADWLASLAVCEKIIQSPANKPGKRLASGEKKLSEFYFHHLNSHK